MSIKDFTILAKLGKKNYIKDREHTRQYTKYKG